MFGSESDDESWREGFSDFMRNVRIVKEETIEAYIDYIEKVAAKLGKRCVDLACSSSQLNKTFTSIDNVKDWARKTKDNYKTALNRLNAYLMSRDGGKENDNPLVESCSSKDSCNADSDEEKKDIGIARNMANILMQINEIEKMAREHEDKTWNSVFKCASAYALGMPSIVIALGVNIFGCLFVVTSAVFAFGGVAALIPVLRRPGRQLNEIQSYGERMYFERKMIGCIRPVGWTLMEKVSLVASAAFLLISILLLGLAKVFGS